MLNARLYCSKTEIINVLSGFEKEESRVEKVTRVLPLPIILHPFFPALLSFVL